MKTNVLLIDDSDSDTRIIREMLDEALGEELKFIHKGGFEGAVEELISTHPDVVMIAQGFQENTGLDFLREAMTINAQLPLILLTGHDDQHLHMEAIDAGASDFLTFDELNPKLLARSISYARNRKKADLKLRESKDELIRHMLDLRDAKERAELQSSEYIQMAESLAVAKGDIEAALHQAEESERLYKVLAENSPVGIWNISVDGYTLYMNSAIRNLLEIDDIEDLRGVTCDSLVTEKYREEMHAAYERWLQGQKSELEASVLCRKSGNVRHIVISGVPLLSSGGLAQSVLTTVVDITERKEVEAAIQHMAQHDALTGLPNRILFHDRLEQALANANRSHKFIAVMFLDLDHFKNINDTMGHPAGDQLLKDVSARLVDSARDTDTVARFGGDEFALICTRLEHPEEVSIVARRIINSIAQPFEIEGEKVHTGTSIGITIFPDDAYNPGQLIKFADMALYHSKEVGRGTFHFYNEKMDEKVRLRKELEAKMRDAIIDEAFILHYQPQVNLQSGDRIGAEALIRWHHSDNRIISPAEFIPLAEDTGLIKPIGEWVLRTACLQAKAWHDSGHPPISIAVNLSAVQFKHSDLIETVREILEITKFPSELLELEITESMVMENVDEAVKTMRGLTELGVSLAIDDFGTGFSSLAYLKKFPVSKLKIDRSFVCDILTDSDDAIIAASIINLGHSLNMKVIAEGVETEQQAEFLRNDGCDNVQGFHFGKPLPADEFYSA